MSSDLLSGIPAGSRLPSPHVPAGTAKRTWEWTSQANFIRLSKPVKLYLGCPVVLSHVRLSPTVTASERMIWGCSAAARGSKFGSPAGMPAAVPGVLSTTPVPGAVVPSEAHGLTVTDITGEVVPTILND